MDECYHPNYIYGNQVVNYKNLALSKNDQTQI